ncbi:MAG: hypothetical protein QG646_2437 [Euryarchaeota archaeon]|nr:hypothetical protein [Euryarchaeota archaeon]
MQLALPMFRYGQDLYVSDFPEEKETYFRALFPLYNLQVCIRGLRFLLLHYRSVRECILRNSYRLFHQAREYRIRCSVLLLLGLQLYK